MTLQRAKYVQRDLPQPQEESECACERTWWPDGDFGFFAGIALIILAMPWGCENSETKSRAALLDSCRKAMETKATVPEMCGVAMGKNR